ncbi:cytochrome P450 [Lindgomyces ingoldianus]|uniref:Cytochrome P450 n=1 Tax=Lindgomyces ingoldianus TaxID=673940 RepID=A0ACB6Q7D7_9PLEO|nr:cytochrome P450 [Lindgomyces ingoldianus]KAF2462884.1 cytochrome P450 [Lindgomyces ingoldianus]
MLTSIVLVLFSLLVIYRSLSFYRSLQHHISQARESGLKFYISPFYFQSVPWILLQEALLPVLLKLPTSWTDSWLPLSLFFRIWHYGYKPFEAADNDTFIVASSGGNVLWTCDPDVIMQVSSRHKDFVKPIGMLGMLNIYGPTITASEGEEHRTYRRIAAPSFNEETHRTVWEESLKQGEMMLQVWSENSGSVKDLNSYASLFALHVLSKAFFQKQMTWDEDHQLPSGHTLPYADAVSSVFKYAQTLFMMPRRLLEHSPSSKHKKAIQAFVEFRKYMDEMVIATSTNVGTTPHSEGGNLLQNFVKATFVEDTALNITHDAVLGNLFIFILAGHETSANTMTFAIALLAYRPRFQAALHADLDSILGEGDPTTWSYSHHYPKLINGHVGALMKETLRLYTVLPFFPKTNEHFQTLSVQGESVAIHPKTLIMVNTSATHRNPKYWPTAREHSKSEPPHPLSSFNPERWLQRFGEVGGETESNFKPGSYIPFAEGFRSCMGSRFASIEFCAAIARIFSQYRVEFEGGTSPEALRKAEQQLSSGVGFELGLKLKDPLVVRFVKRNW